MKQSGIYGATIKKESTNNALEHFGLVVGHGGGGISGVGELGLFTINGLVPLRWGVGGEAWLGVFEFVEGRLNITWHGEVDSTVLVVPFKGDAAVQGTFPVGGCGVVRVEGCEQVFSVLLSHIFYAKVVDDEREANRPGVMFPEAVCVFGGSVAVGGESLLQKLVG